MKTFIKLFLSLGILSTFLISCSEDDEFMPCPAKAESGNITSREDGSAGVYTSIVINARPEQVWEVLTDFSTMPNWSSSFQGLQGDPSDGVQANALFLVEGNPAPVSFSHRLIWEEGKRFGWSDPILFAPGVVDYHLYVVEPCGDQTLFIQTDNFTGTDEMFSPQVLATILLGGYQTFNRELKAEVERRFANP